MRRSTASGSPHCCALVSRQGSRLSERPQWNEPPPDVVWNAWGSARRVRIEHAPVMLFARAVKDGDPVYASEAAARAAGFDRVPVPPTYTFVMTHAGAF